MSRIPVCAAVLMAFLGSDASYAASPQTCGDDMDCLRQLHSNHRVKNVTYWKAFQALPIDRRILAAPAQLVDYLSLDNQINELANQPRTAKPQRQFLKDMNDALGEIPATVKALIDTRLMGVFLVEDLGGTGFTDYVFDEERNPVGAFVVLDAGVLTQSANSWATWKETSPFVADPAFGLQAIIEGVEDDNRKQALQYILLHEFGHVASIGRDFHPRWDQWDCRKDPPAQYPFFELSWKLNDSPDCKVVSKFDQSGFSYRVDVIYYFGARLAESLTPDVYAQLEQTNFPSLYAATSPADDFAESFVTYVHQIMMAKPFEILIEKQGQPATNFKGCWGTTRCGVKQAMIAGLFTH